MAADGKLTRREKGLFIAPLFAIGLIFGGRMLYNKYFPTTVITVEYNPGDYKISGLGGMLNRLDREVQKHSDVDRVTVSVNNYNGFASYSRNDQIFAYGGNYIDPKTLQAAIHRDYVTYLDASQLHQYLQHPQQLFENERRHLPHPTPKPSKKPALKAISG